VNNWQLLYIIAGCLSIVVGILACCFLRELPEILNRKCRITHNISDNWQIKCFPCHLGLKQCEKVEIMNHLQHDSKCFNRWETERIVTKELIKHIVSDVNTYFYMLLYVGTLTSVNHLSVYLTTMVKVEMQYKNITDVYLMSIPPSVIAVVISLLIAYSSSRFNERCYHICASLVVAIVGYIVLIILDEKFGSIPAAYAAICLCYAGSFSALPLVPSLIINNTFGQTKRVLVLSVSVGVGHFSGIVSAYVS
jgi:sugar phosphate permease